MIEFRVFGTLVLRDGNGEEIRSVLAQPKRVALLTYLAMARPRGFHRRDTLLALLWPEQDEQHARWALNQALRHLRNELGKEVVSSRGDGEVGIDPERLSCDAVDFEAALEADEHARALELYRGDLLDGFHVSGCGDFERWLNEERVWLRRRAARAASALARREEARGELVAAGHWARRAFGLSPDDEGEARSLIELLGRVGDRAGAVQTYEEFARRLHKEYELEPAPETRDLIAAVRARQRSALEPSPGVGTEALPSHGREVTSVTQALTTPLRPLGGRRRKVALVLSSLVLAGIGAGGWGLWLPRTEPAELTASSTIAVLPFAYRGAPEFAYLGEGMVDLLSANLDGAGEIRTVAPQTVLALMRHVGDETSEPEEARKVVAHLSAGSFVLGDIVEAGGQLRVSARLYAMSHGKQMPVSVAVQGHPTQLFQLVDRLTAQLIAGRTGEPTADMARLAALTTDSLPPLKAYLEGERHYRAGRLDSSLLALDRAVQLDSAFALAHYRMASAAMWTNRRNRAVEAADRALRLAHRLSDRDRRLIGALSASLHGRIRDAERIYREIVSRHPEDVEASYQLGDLIFHHPHDLGRSWLDAREHFERVLSIDAFHQGSLYHLSNIAARERTNAQLDSLTTRLLEIVPLPPAWFYRAQRAVVFGDTAELTRFITALRTYSDDVAQPTAGFVVATTGDLVVGRRLWKLLTEPSRSLGVRVLAHLTLAKIEVMTGRWRAAKVELEAAKGLDFEAGLEHWALLSLWPLLRPPRSELLQVRDSLLKWKAAAEPTNETTMGVEHAPAHSYLRVYLLGLLSARLGEYDDTRQYAGELTRQARASFAPSFVEQLGRTLRAEVARGQGRIDDALSILDSLSFWTPERLELTGESPFYSYEYESILRADLLYVARRYDDALRAYRTMADGLFHSGAPAHLRMAEIYHRQGERQKAAEHYARFIELWKDSDPELRPVVDEARRRIQRLKMPP